MDHTLILASRPRHPFRRAVIGHLKVEAVRADDQDWKLFLLSFTAFFVCFYTFIA